MSNRNLWPVPPPSRLAKRLWLIPLAAVALWACDSPLEPFSGAGQADVTPFGEIAAAKDGGETAGNNLSFPVIWSDGVSKALRGTYGTELSGGYYFTADGFDWYVQNDPANEWQAGSLDAVTSGFGAVAVDRIDWGDNLEAKAWPFGAQVRVETVLYQDLTTPLAGYTMKIEDETISGVDEVWGTNFVTYDSYEATVYSGMARLVIQKLTKERDDPTLSLTWDPIEARWTGDVGGPLFSGAVWNAVDGPTGYSAEINVQGKVIYGYNWVTKRDALGAGDYRITFVLDDTNAPITYHNTVFDASTSIMVPVEEEVVAAEEGSDTGGATAHVDDANDLTYIDVRLTLKNGKDGNGGKGGGGGKGKKSEPGESGNGGGPPADRGGGGSGPGGPGR